MRASGRGKLILFTVLLALFGLFVGVRYFFLDVQNATGQLKLISSPQASVFIDNVASGTTPFEKKLRVGEYLVKLIPQGEATETASWQGRIKVYKNSLSYVNRELGSSDLTSAGEIFTVTKMDMRPKQPNTGEIYIDTEPTGAIINLDNDEKGIAPLILSEVTKGTHELSVFLPGFFRRTQKINIDEGYRVNAAFKLAIDQGQKKATPSAKLKDKEATKSAATKKTQIKISSTPTGFLRVRSEPSSSASESAQVKPGETFDLIEEQEGWYKIEYEEGEEGWVSAEYSEKVEE